jgi:hypothetical protein
MFLLFVLYRNSIRSYDEFIRDGWQGVLFGQRVWHSCFLQTSDIVCVWIVAADRQRPTYTAAVAAAAAAATAAAAIAAAAIAAAVAASHSIVFANEEEKKHLRSPP